LHGTTALAEVSLEFSLMFLGSEWGVDYCTRDRRHTRCSGVQ